MTSEAPLLIRADATANMGTGHAMRCLSLAQAWQDSAGSCMFAMAETTPAVRRRIESEGCAVFALETQAGGEDDSNQLIRLARERDAAYVVVDGYQFDADFQSRLKAAGLKTLFLDDYGHAGHYSADLLLNQNISADERLYKHREPGTKLLLGPHYALLRREFQKWHDYGREIPAFARKVLITLGGSDPEGLTIRVLEAMARVELEKLEAIVVMGGSNPYFAAIQHSAVELATERGLKISVQRDVANMAECMAWADVAISAAGTTCWELCLLGLPALLIDVAANQTAVARELNRIGAAVHVGAAKEISGEHLSRELDKTVRSQELRRSLSSRSRELVDGRGARRVVSAMRGAAVRLRPVQEQDIHKLFEWANDPDVRAAAFSPEPISWKVHTAWFSEQLKSDQSFIWIAEDAAGTPVGQIRFDVRQDGEAEVDVSIALPMRGRGLGQEVIRLGVETFLKQGRSTVIRAFVKEANRASISAFQEARFVQAGTAQVRGNTAIRLCYKEPNLNHG